MQWWKRIIGRQDLYKELSREIQEHLEQKIEELVASGMSRAEATHAARREFGNVSLVEEDSRSTWRWSSLESWFCGCSLRGANVTQVARIYRRSDSYAWTGHRRNDGDLQRDSFACCSILCRCPIPHMW